MKRRNVIRKVATGSLLVAGVGSAEAVNTGSDSTVYKLRSDGETFEVAETLDGGDVGTEHHCEGGRTSTCCEEYCCNCDASACDVCYCHQYC